MKRVFNEIDFRLRFIRYTFGFRNRFKVAHGILFYEHFVVHVEENRENRDS